MACVWCDTPVNMATEYKPIVTCSRGCDKTIHLRCLAEAIVLMNNEIVTNYFMTIKGCVCRIIQ